MRTPTSRSRSGRGMPDLVPASRLAEPRRLSALAPTQSSDRKFRLRMLLLEVKQVFPACFRSTHRCGHRISPVSAGSIEILGFQVLPLRERRLTAQQLVIHNKPEVRTP